MTDTHSPLPWRVHKQETSLGNLFWVKDAADNFVIHEPFQQETAALIVQAVNERQELIEALEAAGEVLLNYHNGVSNGYHDVGFANEMVQDALSLLKGNQTTQTVEE